jgi:hypothetical protein
MYTIREDDDSGTWLLINRSTGLTEIVVYPAPGILPEMRAAWLAYKINEVEEGRK